MLGLIGRWCVFPRITIPNWELFIVRTLEVWLVRKSSSEAFIVTDSLGSFVLRPSGRLRTAGGMQ